MVTATLSNYQAGFPFRYRTGLQDAAEQAHVADGPVLARKAAMRRFRVNPRPAADVRRWADKILLMGELLR